MKAACDLLEVDQRLNEAVRAKVSKKLFKRGQRVAIDLVLNPYHGRETEANAAEMTHGERRDGTALLHTYATAYVLVHGQRFTLALTFVWVQDRLVEVLQRVRERLHQRGIKTKLLLLDRQFLTVEIISVLQCDHQLFILPVIIRGKLEPPGGTRVLLVVHRSHGTRYRIKSAAGTTATFEVAVAACSGACHRSRSGHQGEVGRQIRVYMVFGLRSHPSAIAQIYRRRFGIESSYR